MSKSDAINDLLVLVRELIDNLGPESVAEGMSDQGWIKPDSGKIIEWVTHYFENEVLDDEFDAITEEVYSEFYNIANSHDYQIKTTYSAE